jgi:hypothetical protein
VFRAYVIWFLAIQPLPYRELPFDGRLAIKKEIGEVISAEWFLDIAFVTTFVRVYLAYTSKKKSEEIK